MLRIRFLALRPGRFALHHLEVESGKGAALLDLRPSLGVQIATL